MTTIDDICVLVFTSALNLRERALASQSTWMKDFLHAYLVGGYYYDSKLKMISLGKDVGEDYFSATPKQFLGLKVLYEKFSDKKWFYITGCDAYVYAKPLCAMLNQFDATKPLYIGGNFLKRTVSDTEFFFPAGGCGFVLSNALVKKLLPHINFILDDLCKYELFYKDGACDAAMGYYLLKLLDIKPIYAQGFYQVQPYRYPGDFFYNAQGDFVTEPLIADPIAFHTLTIRELYKLRYLYCKKHLLTKKASCNKDYQLKERKFIDKVLDKLTFILTRKIKTKKIVNCFFRFIYQWKKYEKKYN